jgi:hypothetical protein
MLHLHMPDRKRQQNIDRDAVRSPRRIASARV